MNTDAKHRPWDDGWTRDGAAYVWPATGHRVEPGAHGPSGYWVIRLPSGEVYRHRGSVVECLGGPAHAVGWAESLIEGATRRAAFLASNEGADWRELLEAAERMLADDDGAAAIALEAAIAKARGGGG